MPKSADKPLKWTPAREMALKLVFEGRWTQEEIARKLIESDDAAEDGDDADADDTTAAQLAGDDNANAAAAKMSERVRISTRTLRRWIANPDFQARLDALRADFAGTLRGVAYADKTQRIIGLSQMAESARREYEERPWLKEVRPTPDGELTNEHFNKDAHAAFRESLAEIAAELGARKNVTELSATLDVNGNVHFYMPEPERPPAEAVESSAEEQALHERDDASQK